MQRVSAFLPSWEKRNSGASSNSKRSASGGLGWWSAANNKRASANGPNGLPGINTAAANSDNGRIQREAFWPTTLDLECDKAARIIKSFCCDGYLAPADDEKETEDGDSKDTDNPPSASTEPRTPVKVNKKIPKRVIQNAAGIAVFTCMRNGLWMTGSGGSGILIARKSDGTWSPPSGIMLHTPTLSFIIGVDVYDCVLVINNLAALESLTRPRLTLGEDVGLTGGPLVTLDSTETDIAWKDLGNTVFTYLKARGQHQIVNLNGCILTERANENDRFYAGNVGQMDILSGNVGRQVEETGPLFDVIKMAEGRTDFNKAAIDKLAAAPAPSDAVIATPKSTPASPRTAFGMPNLNDPDPFGVLALEMAGLEIREAGSKLRPASSQLDFNPAPSSPALSKFNRQSVETFTTKSNRGSLMSTHTTKSQVTDMGTQTDIGKTPVTTPSPGQSEDGVERGSFERILEVKEDDEVDYTTVDLTPLKHLSQEHAIEIPLIDQETSTNRDSARLAPTNNADDMDKESKASSVYTKDDSDDEDGHETNDTNDADDEDDEDDDEEEPVVFEVAQVQPARTQAVASRMIHAKGAMVTIPKRLPPPLPTRSAARLSRSSKSEMGDVASLRSPLRQDFSETETNTKRESGSTATEVEGPVPEGLKIEITSDDVKPEGPKAEEPNAEEPKVEEPEVEEPTADDLKTEEPKTEEPKADESSNEELRAEEPKAEEVDAEEVKAEAGRAEEIKDDVETQDVNTENATSEKSQPEEPQAAEASTGENSAVAEAEETKPEQAKTADATTEDVTVKEEEDVTSTNSGDSNSVESTPKKSSEAPKEESEEESKTQKPTVDKPKTEVGQPEVSDVDVSLPEKQGPSEAEADDSSKDDDLFKTPPSEQSDTSDSTSNKKHSSSIYTGATEDRWSVDGSSLTTPTSERPFSSLDDATGDDTPTKEKDRADMKETERHTAEERETTPTAVTVP